MVNFTVTGCPAVEDRPDGRVFLRYGNWTDQYGWNERVNPTAKFEGDPGTGTLRVTSPPEGVGPQIEVIAICTVTEGTSGSGDFVSATFTITGLSSPPGNTTSSFFRVLGATARCAGVITAVAASEALIAATAGALLVKVTGGKGLAAAGNQALRGHQGWEFGAALKDVVDIAIELAPRIGSHFGGLIYDACRPAQLSLSRYLGG